MSAHVNGSNVFQRQPASERTPWLRLVRTEPADEQVARDPIRQLQSERKARRIAAADALDAYANLIDREFRPVHANSVPARASARSRRAASRLRDGEVTLDRDDRAAMELVVDRIESRLDARWPEADPVLEAWADAIRKGM